jgi:hypothetical protein
MRKRLNLPMLALMASLGACAPEVTAPEGGAGVGRVVPMAVPDVWCPGSAAAPDTTDAKRPRVTCDAPKQSPGATDSMVVVDSTSNQ